MRIALTALQKTEKKGEREKGRLNDGNNNGLLRIANATSGGAPKAAWAKRSRRAKVGNKNGPNDKVNIFQKSF